MLPAVGFKTKKTLLRVTADTRCGVQMLNAHLYPATHRLHSNKFTTQSSSVTVPSAATNEIPCVHCS